MPCPLTNKSVVTYQSNRTITFNGRKSKNFNYDHNQDSVGLVAKYYTPG